MKTTYLSESNQFTVSGISVHEIKALDQFSGAYDDLVKQYNLNKGICGYIVCAMGPYLATEIVSPFDVKSINRVIEETLRKEVFLPLVKEKIVQIQSTKKPLLKEKEEAKSNKEYDDYDEYVSNFDICDNISVLDEKMKENLFILVQNDWRFSEDDPPIEELLMIEVFYPERLMLTVGEFISNIKPKLNLEKKPLTFIADLAGHFLCFSVFKRKNEVDAFVESTILLVDSTNEKLLDYTEFITTLAKLCF